MSSNENDKIDAKEIIDLLKSRIKSRTRKETWHLWNEFEYQLRQYEFDELDMERNNELS